MSVAIERWQARKVELSYLQTVGEVLAKSHFFQDAQTAERAVAKILAGQEFGMGALEAMRAFHVIDGKVEMSADAQARLVKQSEKYDYTVAELTDDICSILFWENDDELGTSTFTIGDAERAGIVKNEGAWKKYPRNMLFARALTNGVAWFCPDAISGGRVYAPGEVSDEVWNVATSEVSVDPEAIGLDDGTTVAGELEPDVSHTGGSAVGIGESAERAGVGETDSSRMGKARAPEPSTSHEPEPETDAVVAAPVVSDAGEVDRASGISPATSPSDPAAVDAQNQEQKDAYLQAFREGPGLPDALMMAKKLFQTEVRRIKNWNDFYALSVEEMFQIAKAFEEMKAAEE